MQGNIACAEGALAAGCSFMAGYPITPATEIAERLASRLPALRDEDGVFIQMEDEISSLAAVIGASWTGKKAMTATSGPGISLMQEHIGYAVGTETPCVIVDVQRGGPTTGIPSVELQGDTVQVRRGSHGEYQIIALAPSSPQELFDHTILAFNYAELYRTPVFVLSDAFIGHMREEVVIPEPEDIEIVTRIIPEAGFNSETDQGFLSENVAPMPIFGRGFKSHVTSSCHTETGKRNVTDAFALDNFIRKLDAKISKHRDEIIMVEDNTQDADIAIMSYGGVYRAACEAAGVARKEGIRTGTFRPITVWPFPDREIAEMSKRVKAILVMENNLGQLVPYVKAEASCPVHFIAPEILGTLHDVGSVVSKLKEIA
ncbi:MAG: 2-oxoacid:acceptor oxidoreductase subunit alpha [Candidatus Latescibacteria bacterium]|nr:2-oxoacid:acceptor oxidoreductase subunit alpha [Candidatus Latescibacterota bacterium]